MSSTLSSPLWKPTSYLIQHSHMSRFMKHVRDVYKNDASEMDSPISFHQWTIREFPKFWWELAHYTQVLWEKPPSSAFSYDLLYGRNVPSHPNCTHSLFQGKFFPDSELNFAKNLLKFALSPEPADRKKVAVVGLTEEHKNLKIPSPRIELSFEELYHQVALCAQRLKTYGVQKGDAVAGVLSNTPEAVIAMLATTSLGATWSSCSPDFGVDAVCDRLAQVQPKVVFMTEAYTYGGRFFSCVQKNEEICSKIKSIEHAIIVNHLDAERFRAWDGHQANTESTLDFVSVPFEHPLYIMFSSGTTGVPKCIVHGTGGTLLQHQKELLLHTNCDQASKIMYYTTCGWMMWNWVVSSLSVGATLVTYDGSPAFPHRQSLWDYAKKEQLTILGTSPKYIGACLKKAPSPSPEESSLKTILSTGSPLLPEHFHWIYKKFPSIHLASISGGTDILSCFMLGHPLLPVYEGEIQAPGLGMAVEAWNDQGETLSSEKGELVCTQPFVSMPIGFLEDPDHTKYKSAYFEHFLDINKEVWRHGDYISISKNGGITVFGRSDATLNPGGVRIGTAELYRSVESIDDILDSLAIGHEINGDVLIYLFVKRSPDAEPWGDDVCEKIKKTVKSQLTSRHVPNRIFPVQDIPYTRSGKKVEIAVKKIFASEEVKNVTALSNPECLDEYKNIRKTFI